VVDGVGIRWNCSWGVGKSQDGGILLRLKNCTEDMNEWGRKL